MTQKPGNTDEGGQNSHTDLYLLSHHLSDMAWVTPAASKTDWKPNTVLPADVLEWSSWHWDSQKSWWVQCEHHAFKVM